MGGHDVEIVWKTAIWGFALLLWILAGMVTDPTVREHRRRKKQEKLAMDFHSKLERGAPRDE